MCVILLTRVKTRLTDPKPKKIQPTFNSCLFCTHSTNNLHSQKTPSVASINYYLTPIRYRQNSSMLAITHKITANTQIRSESFSGARGGQIRSRKSRVIDPSSICPAFRGLELPRIGSRVRKFRAKHSEVGFVNLPRRACISPVIISSVGIYNKFDVIGAEFWNSGAVSCTEFWYS
ncbi:hypothetical protein ACS0TY_023943 [Phlomoides rotata]